MFGSLCHQALATGLRSNKALPATAPKIFLGYDQAGSFQSAIPYYPLTKRTSIAQLQDLKFNEQKHFKNIDVSCENILTMIHDHFS